MAYKITGTTNYDATVYVVNDTTNMLEAAQDVTAGTYEIMDLSPGTKTVTGRTSGGQAIAYGNIESIFDQKSIVPESITRGSMTVVGSLDSVTTNLNDISKSISIYNGSLGTDSGLLSGEHFTTASLALEENNGKIDMKAYRQSTTGPIALFYETIEFRDGVKNIQHGTSSTTETITLSGINLANSTAYLPGTYCASGQQMYVSGLTSSSISLTRTNTSYSVPQAWQVIEFPDGYISSKQDGSVYISSGTEANASITAVDLDRSILFYKGDAGPAPAGSSYNRMAMNLTSSTNVRAWRIGDYQSSSIFFTVMEFEPGIIKSIQRGYTTETTSQDIPINSVDINKTIVMSNGNTVGNDYSNRWRAVYLADSTTLKYLTSSTDAGGIAWQVIEFT